ncbi:MAG: YlmC/YmxH family sporulation protein [Oscillospiraceae bacterium]|nr:YlmC/YmxH family sporulation protein [Oscillospiraceae bacterium]
MDCRVRDMRLKEVININDGARLGYVSDLEFRLPEGQILGAVVQTPGRFFGLFGRGEEFFIPWDAIRQMGDDIILIEKSVARQPAKTKQRKWS